MQDALEHLGVRPDTLTQQEKDQLDQQRFIRAETRARLTPAARYVLGIDEV